MTTTADLRTLFRQQFPELSAVTDADVDRHMTLAREIHALKDLATVHLAAHLHVLEAAERPTGGAKIDGGSGLVTTQSVGAMSVSYSRDMTRQDREAYFARSAYGRMFLVLEQRATATTPIVIL